MDRLINWRDLRQEDLPDVEGPLFAVVKVKNILASRTSAAGVDDLLRKL